MIETNQLISSGFKGLARGPKSKHWTSKHQRQITAAVAQCRSRRYIRAYFLFSTSNHHLNEQRSPACQIPMVRLCGSGRLATVFVSLTTHCSGRSGNFPVVTRGSIGDNVGMAVEPCPVCYRNHTSLHPGIRQLVSQWYKQLAPRRCG